MSYEKKKLAGVGNTHLYQYQTPGLMEQDHPDVYPMRMNPMQQYPCPMQPPPQQTHTMNPADQCLSTPQPPSQTNDMVDNGSCMAAVSRVVMEDPMQEPTDNLGLDDAYRTGETAVQQPTLEMPIRAEVVMEPDPNEDEAEPDGEDDVEKSRISSKKHCFVCNTQLPEDIETAVPFFKTETTKTNKKFSAVITKLVGRSITPRKAHSEIICRRCFNLLDRIDTLEVELRDSKDEVISMYKTTLDIYGGKTRRKRTVVSRKSPFLYSKNTKVGRTSAVKSPKIEKQETIEAQVPTTTQAVENVVDTGVPTTSYEQSCSSMPKGLEMDDDIDDMEDLDDSKKTEEEGSKDTAQKKRNRKFKKEENNDKHWLGIRGQIIGMHRAGKRKIEIVQALGCSKHMVYKWIKRYHEKGNIRSLPRPGAPRKLTPEEEDALVDHSMKNPNLDSISIKKELRLDHVSCMTVRRRLYEDGPLEKRKKNKHHRVTTEEEDNAIKSLMEMYPNLTAVAVKRQLGLAATIQTISNRMKEFKGIKIPKRSQKDKGKKVKKKNSMASSLNSSTQDPLPSQRDMLYVRQNQFPDQTDSSVYKVPSEAYFSRENKPSSYSNEPMNFPNLPHWYQQFYPN